MCENDMEDNVSCLILILPTIVVIILVTIGVLFCSLSSYYLARYCLTVLLPVGVLSLRPTCLYPFH